MILLDTHVIIWLAFDQSRLSKKARQSIDTARESGGGLAICDVSLREISVIASKGRIRLSTSLKKFLSEVEARFIVLPIRGRASVRALRLPENYPGDPADRMIAATALVEGLALVIADRAIRSSHAVPTIW